MAKEHKPENGSFFEATIIVALLLVVLAVYLLWTRQRQLVILPVFGLDWLQYGALRLLGLLDGKGRGIMDWIQMCLVNRSGEYDPSSIDWPNLKAVQEDIGSRTRYALCAAGAGLAATVLFRMRGEGLKRQFSLTGRAYEDVFRFCGIKVEGKRAKFLKYLLRLTGSARLLSREDREWVAKGASFMHYQADHWEVTLAGAHFDPDRDNPREARQMTPAEWLRDNKVRLTRKAGLDDDAMIRAFERQLGPTWQGVEKTPYQVQAICVLAALNVKRDKRVSALRGRLTRIHALHPGSAESLTRAAIAPFMADRKIVDAINRHGSRHAFLNTAVVGIYGWGGPMKEWGGGNAGVLSTGMFRWLKGVDRTLWYSLNNVGRRAYHIEGAAVVSHFQAERIGQQALPDHFVDSAVDGLVQYLEERGIVDLEEHFRVDNDF